jgi:hypothetical protein
VVDDDLFALACGPDTRVRSYTTCVVNGVRFNTVERDKNKKTQNSRLACRVHINQRQLIIMAHLKRLLRYRTPARMMVHHDQLLFLDVIGTNWMVSIPY